MMRNGKLYQLLNSERLTYGKGFGLWPTPTASEAEHPDMVLNTKKRRESVHGKTDYSLNLADSVKLWPTPQAGGTGRVIIGTPTAKMSIRSEKFRRNATPMPLEFVRLYPTPRANSGDGAGFHGGGGLGLQTKVKLLETYAANAKNNTGSLQAGRGTLTAPIESLWPTARAGGMCGGTGNWAQLKKKAGDIKEARQMGAGNGGQLNPDWVEALMGFPQGWTDIDADATTGAEYPARWLEGTWEDGIPRVASSVKNRTNRLKCLGNAVVPQIPRLLWKLVSRAYGIRPIWE
jgi:hypothetical protein